jgi:hypothetical protein
MKKGNVTSEALFDEIFGATGDPEGFKASLRANPEKAGFIARGLAVSLVEVTGDKPHAILTGVLFLRKAGLDLQTAYDAVCGKGQYDRLIESVYQKARATA